MIITPANAATLAARLATTRGLRRIGLQPVAYTQVREPQLAIEATGWYQRANGPRFQREGDQRYDDLAWRVHGTLLLGTGCFEYCGGDAITECCQYGNKSA